MGYALGVACIFALAALVVEYGMRLVRLPGRWAIVCTMGCSVIVPIFHLYEPTVPTASPISTPTLDVGNTLFLITSALPKANDVRIFDAPLVGLWIVVSSVFLSILIATQIRIRRVTSSYDRDVVSGTSVLRSGTLGPAVVGWLKGNIVLPRWADEVDERWRELMVQHEREHLRKGDAQLLLAAVLLGVLLPWNLPLWWMVYRLRRAIELDCDQRVLGSGVDVLSYGALLLEVSRRRTRTTLPLIAFAVSKSFLSRRVDAMTQHMSKFRLPRLLGSLGAGLFLVVMACELPGPTGVEEGLAGPPLVEVTIVQPDSNAEKDLRSIAESDSLASIPESILEQIEIGIYQHGSDSALREVTEAALAEISERLTTFNLSTFNAKSQLAEYSWRFGEMETPTSVYIGTAEDLPAEQRAVDVYAVANDSTLVRVPQEIVERMRQGKFLLSVYESNGVAQIVLESADGRNRAVFDGIPTEYSEQRE